MALPVATSLDDDLPDISREQFRSSQALVHELRSRPALLTRLQAVFESPRPVTRHALKLLLAFNVYRDEEQRQSIAQELRLARLSLIQAGQEDDDQRQADVYQLTELGEREDNLIAQDHLLGMAQEMSLLRAQKLCAQEELDEALDAMPLATLEDHQAKAEQRKPLDKLTFAKIEDLEMRLDHLEEELESRSEHLGGPHKLAGGLAQRMAHEKQHMQRVQNERETTRLVMLEQEETDMAKLLEL